MCEWPVEGVGILHTVFARSDAAAYLPLDLAWLLFESSDYSRAAFIINSKRNDHAWYLLSGKSRPFRGSRRRQSKREQTSFGRPLVHGRNLFFALASCSRAALTIRILAAAIIREQLLFIFAHLEVRLLFESGN